MNAKDRQAGDFLFQGKRICLNLYINLDDRTDLCKGAADLRYIKAYKQYWTDSRISLTKIILLV